MICEINTHKNHPLLPGIKLRLFLFNIHCLPFYLLHLRLFRNALGYNTLKLLKKIALSSA